MSCRLDHLVVIAATLEQGRQWCKAQLGVSPVAGGDHVLMGTHNCLLNISSTEFPQAYLEIIAINPLAEFPTAQRKKRWFGMDDPALQARLAQTGPRLLHWVVSSDMLDSDRAKLMALGLDVGPVLALSRNTANGLLEWNIAVRDDGRLPLGGCLPSLIEWPARHPVQSLPHSGIQLQASHIEVPQAALLNTALQALGMQASVQSGTENLRATLVGPQGRINLNVGTTYDESAHTDRD